MGAPAHSNIFSPKSEKFMEYAPKPVPLFFLGLRVTFHKPIAINPGKNFG